MLFHTLRISHTSVFLLIPFLFGSVDSYGGNTHLFHQTTTSVTIQVDSSWNLISLPIQGKRALAGVFPSAISSAYRFVPGSGYVEEDTLESGFGYWIKFPAAEQIAINGTATARDTTLLDAGWNLVGSIAYPVAVSGLQQLPPGIGDVSKLVELGS